MDWQSIFNVAVPTGATVVVAWIGSIHKALAAAKDELSAFKVKVAEDYAKHTDLDRIFDALSRIESKLDKKADRA